MKNISGRAGYPFIISLLVFYSSCLLAADTRYITDALTVYLHGGPGTNYRIVGAMKAGDPVTLLAVDHENKFAQIQDPKGRSAWIALSYLTPQPSLKIRLPQLEQQLGQLTQQLQTVNADWQQRTVLLQKQAAASEQRILQLQQDNSHLTEQHATLQQQLKIVNQQVNRQQYQQYWEWFRYGGVVAGGGVLLGLLIPAIVNRRTHHSRWMN